jgi:peroxiredoxin Q/BCP
VAVNPGGAAGAPDRCAQRRLGMLKPGDVAPDFQVKDHTGRTHKLSEYRGKTVVLWFYPKADTPG